MALNRPSPFMEDTLEDTRDPMQGFETFAPGTKEYERDLKKRRGGLKPNRKADIPMINQTLSEIANRSLTDDQVANIIQRNPSSANLFGAALQRRQQEDSIIAQGTQVPGQFNPKATIKGDQTDQSFFPQDVQQREGKLNINNAIKIALKEGRFDVAQKLSKFLPRSSKSSEGTVTITTRDDQGRPVTKVVPKSQAVGRSFVKPFKNISVGESQKITKDVSRFRKATDLFNRFQPSFSGKGLRSIGEAQNALQKRSVKLAQAAGVPKGQARWWIDYQELRNQVRNSLFGGALTPTEAAEFLKQDINLESDPDTVRKILARQQKILNTALARQRDALISDNRNPKAVNRLFGGVGGTSSQPQTTQGGLTAKQQKRLEELRRKQGR